MNEALVLLNIMEEEEAAQQNTGDDAEVSSADPAENTAEGEASEESVPEGIPTSIWVNDDGMIIQVDVDLAGYLQKLMDGGLEILLTDYDLDGLILASELKYIDVRLTFSQFDEVPALRLPDN